MISSVIVNHKSFNFIEPLIESLKNEGVEDIVIVDNSLDSKEKAKLQNLKNINLYFLEENKGFGNALNFGVKKAKGEFLLLCNSDLYFKKDSIKELLNGIKNFDAAGPQFFWDRREEFYLPYPIPISFLSEFLGTLFPEIRKKIYLKYQFEIWNSENFKKLKILSGSSFIIKRGVFEKVGGFDENFFLYFEENDFFKRFEKNGFRASFIPTSKVIHFFNLKKDEIHTKYYENSKNFYEKKHFCSYFRLFLKLLRKIRKKEVKMEEIKKEEIKDSALLLSPFNNFIPSVLVKKVKNWGILEEKLKEFSFYSGFLSIVKENSILKSYHFKVK